MRLLDRVAVVFDPTFAAALPALLDTCHVWLVDSPENTAAARRHWAEHPRKPGEPADLLATELSTFKQMGPTPEAALDAVLELVEDHHGEFSGGPEVREVLIAGTPVTDGMAATLDEWGYVARTGLPEGTLASRA